MVGYDSIIPPGREGTISPKVNLKGYHSGHFSKGVTVTSNATNLPTLRLTIKGDIKPIIEVSTRVLRITNDDSEPSTIMLKTEKKDLRIKKVFLRTSGGGKPSWQVDLPHYLEFELVNDTTPTDGYYDHELRVWAKIDLKESAHGEFIIKTNHPDKEEVSIRGSINVPDK